MIQHEKNQEAATRSNQGALILAEVEHRLLAFQERYGQMATPFDWQFTRNDLARVMARLAEPQPLRAVA